MFIILGWHTPWTWHALGALAASLVALVIAPCALILMLPAVVGRRRDPAPPGPGRLLRVAIAVISCGTIVAALFVIGRYWTGPILARWAWAWGVRWMLPVLAVVIVLTLSTRREADRPPPPGGGPAPVGVPGGDPGEVAGGTAAFDVLPNK